MLEEKGRVVEKDELMRTVWPNAIVEENNLTVNMSAAADYFRELRCGEPTTSFATGGLRKLCPIHEERPTRFMRFAKRGSARTLSNLGSTASQVNPSDRS